MMSRTSLLFVFIIAVLGACQSGPGSASMRVQVDVYKGPLANSPEIQKGQLTAVLRSAESAFQAMDNQLVESMCRIGCISETELTGRDAAGYLAFPTAAQCSQRAIPQRSVQSFPAHRDDFNESAYTPLAQPFVAGNGMVRNGELVEEGDPKAAIRPNSDNWISQGSRFPDVRGTNYQVCPSYSRMRIQLGGVTAILEKENDLEARGISTGYLMDRVYNFGHAYSASEVLGAADETVKDLINETWAQCRAIRSQDAKTTCELNARSLEQTGLSILEQYAALRAQLRKEAAETPSLAAPELLGGFDSNDFEMALRKAARDTAALQSKAAELSAALNGITTNLIDAAALSELIASLEPQQVSLAQLEADTPDYTRLATSISKLQSDMDTYSDASIGEMLRDLGQIRGQVSELSAKLIGAERASQSALSALQTKKKQTSFAAALPASATAYEGALVAFQTNAKDANTSLSQVLEATRALAARLDSIQNAIGERATGHQVLKSALEAIDIEASGTAADTALRRIEQAYDAARLLDPKADFAPLLAAIGAARTQNAIILSIGENPDEADSAKLLEAKTALKTALSKLASAEIRPSISNDDLIASDEVKALAAGLASNFFVDLTAKAVPAAMQYVTQTSSYAQIGTNYAALKRDLGELSLSPTQARLINAAGNLKPQLNTLKADLEQPYDVLIQIADAIKTSRSRKETDSYQAIAELAGYMRLVTTSLTTQLVSVEPASKRLRIDIIKLATLTAEYSNQLTARANALSLQSQGVNRSELPTGQYLRDSSPTETIKAYDWFDAAVQGNLGPRARANVSERLFDDDNWARINEAYASGAGETTMAFIRDEIGNWNLKSFSSDPERLVAAYTDLAEDLISTAARVARNASNASDAVATANAARDLASTAQSVEPGSNSNNLRAGALIGQLELSSMRAEFAERLKLEKAKLDQDVEITDQIEAERVACRAEKESEQAGPEALQTCDTDAEKKARQQRQMDARHAAEQIVGEYERLIDALALVATIEPEA